MLRNFLNSGLSHHGSRFFTSFAPKRLPKLIFGENHTDATTNKVLKHLLPSLKSIGYTHFYEEVPAEYTIYKLIESCKLLEKKYAALDAAFKTINLSLSNQSDWKNFILKTLFLNSLKMKFEITPEIISKMYTDIYELTIQYECMTGSKEFYEGLIANAITLRGIDIQRLDKEFTLNQVLDLLDSARENCFSEKTIYSSEKFFQRNGLEHIIPLQKLIFNAKKRPTINEYLFFYLYSQSAKLDTEIHLRKAGLNHTPFPIHAIDCSKLTVTETAQRVLEVIEKSMKCSDETSLETSTKFTP